MAKNKFTVFGGKDVSKDTVMETGSDARNNLFNKGMLPDDLARARDVTTPIRETSLVTVGLLNWLANTTSGISGIKDFETPKVDSSDPTVTEANINAFLSNLVLALNSVIIDGLNSKEPNIAKGTGFLKYDNTSKSWSWDNTNYQEVKTRLTTFLDLPVANKGLIYKSKDQDITKISDKAFVYADEDTSDEYGNLTMNLKRFTFD